MSDRFHANRSVLKSNFPKVRALQTDQDRQLPQPPLQKPAETGLRVLPLPRAGTGPWSEATLHGCLRRRRSRRAFTASSLTLEELAFLLWATQGVQRVFGQNYSTFRPAPSGGARHAFETYLAINRVDTLEEGLYRYLPLTHELLALRVPEHLPPHLDNATLGQIFVGESAVVFIWAAIPYRCEWRYDIASAKILLIDAGHLCQNLYLGCEAIRCGTCAVAMYDQTLMDRLLGIDGEEEFVVYMAPVGKVKG